MGRGRVCQAQSSDCVGACMAWMLRRRQREKLHGSRGGAGWRVRRFPCRACRRRATGRRRGLRCVSWWAARGAPFRPPVPLLGDDGKPLTSLQVKANQHQRELMKEFGENCAEFSEAEHLVRVQADKQAAPVRFTRSPTDTCALPGTERRSCVWARRHSLGIDCNRRPGYRRALGALCAKEVLRFC